MRQFVDHLPPWAALLALLTMACVPGRSVCTPSDDLASFQHFFAVRFPAVPFDDFANGAYAINPSGREQWEELEEFPPYEYDLEDGKKLFNQPFANGAHYGDCFENGGIGIRQTYPRFDEQLGEVITLELALNRCRLANDEAPLPYARGDLAKISAYMAYTSRGKRFALPAPTSPAALAAYEAGKQYYYSKRGQLNMSCADCHVAGGGIRLRSEVTSPALGQPTHFPVFRLKWEELGTLHRRYVRCNEQVRAQPFAPQSATYRNLEYYQTYMSNGLPVNGPGVRK